MITMEETKQEPTNVKTLTITVEGLTPESAEAILQDFIGWLSNSGEQDYWIACDDNSPGSRTTFDYNWEPDKDRYTPWVVIRETNDE